MLTSTSRPSSQQAFTRSSIALLGILVLAFTIRVAGIDWDEGRYLHPDERHIVADVLVGRVEVSWPPKASWADPGQSAINPRPQREGGGYEEFAYGAFPVYMVDTIGAIAEELTGTDWNGYERAQYIGRAISILLDTGTVLLVYLIAASLAGRTAGIFGAAVYAFLPLAIQASHFFTVDSWMTFFIFATIYTCMRAVRDRHLWQFALAGGWFGLALATKTSAAPVAAVIALAIVLAGISESNVITSTTTLVSKILARGTLSLVTFVAVFFVGEPFAFLDPDALLTSFRTQTDIQSGVWDVPFTQQYVGTPRLTYQLGEAIRYSMGPVAVLMGIAGAATLGWMVMKRQSFGAMLVGAWGIVSLFVILVPETKFPRYMLPIAPAVAVCAGIALTAGLVFLNRRYGKRVGVAFAAVMLLLTSGYGAAFAHVTIEEHSRISASVWMYENLEPGSTTTSELWDDRLPLSLMPGLSSDARRIDDANINLYAYTPTYGDIATLAPAIELLPQGDSIAAALTAGDVPHGTSLLREISAVDINAATAVSALPSSTAMVTGSAGASLNTDSGLDVAEFHTALFSGSMEMTTSRTLSQEIQSVASAIATERAITPDHLASIAQSIDTAANETMIRQMYTLFTEADYYVLASDRVQRGMEQNPWRYAVPNRMYELLDSGDIGYSLIEQFQSYPTLFGQTFPDSNADESYRNYDHPTVQIYEKQDLVPYDTFVDLFGSAALAQTEPDRNPDTEPLTFDEPVSDLPETGNYRWSEAISGSSWGASLVWVLMLVALQAAAYPLAATVFRSFPDRGWGLARLVATIVPATILWWLASVGLLEFQSIWVVTTVALFALACWLWFRRGLLRLTAPQMNMIVVAEVIFWVTFLVFLAFKMVNPDSWHPIWGGEKPMEFAQINAILRSATFPPVDPWYAQGYINYYYYSFYLVAFLIKLTGIPIAFAFNLAQPMLMGVLASGTFSVGATIGSRISRGRQSGMLSGLVSVLLVSFAGNMLTVGQLVDDIQGETGLINRFNHWVWAPSRAIIDTDAELIPEFRLTPPANGSLITEFPYFTGLYGDLHSHVAGLPLIVLCIALAASFAFDGNHRDTLVSRASLARFAVAAITLGIVYPTNAWDLPVTAALVAGGIVIGTAVLSSPSRRLLRLGTTLGIVAVGAFVVTLPFLLHFEALFGSIETVPATTTLLELESHVGGLLLVLSAAVPGVFMLDDRHRAMVGAIEMFLVLAATLLLRWATVDLAPSLVPWLDALTVVVVAAIWIMSIPGVIARLRTLDFGLPAVTTTGIAIVTAVVVIGTLIADRAVAALYLGIGLSATAYWLSKHSTPTRFVALLVAGASFIGAGVEVVYLVDDLSGGPWARMNTIFKFYNQIWILLGIAGGAAAGVLAMNVLTRLAIPGARLSPSVESENRETNTTTPIPGAARRYRLNWAIVATVCTLFVITLSAAYPVTATGIRLATRFEPREGGLTLNAYSWMDYGTVQLTDGTTVSFEEDRDVINWFNTEIEGTPVIAEAAFGPYRCNSSRISIGTGLPSVLGWQRHEMQQRYSDVLPPRDADLRELYGASDVDTKRSIIDRYDIEYIVVGDLERNYPVIDGNECIPMSDVPMYSEYDLEAGIATFESMTGRTLEVAFQSGDTIVYRVVGTS